MLNVFLHSLKIKSTNLSNGSLRVRVKFSGDVLNFSNNFGLEDTKVMNYLSSDMILIFASNIGYGLNFKIRHLKIIYCSHCFFEKSLT